MQIRPTLLANPDTPRDLLKEPLAYVRRSQVLTVSTYKAMWLPMTIGYLTKLLLTKNKSKVI